MSDCRIYVGKLIEIMNFNIDMCSDRNFSFLCLWTKVTFHQIVETMN